MKRRHSLVVNIKTNSREDFMQVLRIEIMKIKKMKRALKMEELKKVATIMNDNPWVPKIVKSSVSSVEKWATVIQILWIGIYYDWIWVKEEEEKLTCLDGTIHIPFTYKKFNLSLIWPEPSWGFFFYFFIFGCCCCICIENF